MMLYNIIILVSDKLLCIIRFLKYLIKQIKNITKIISIENWGIKRLCYSINNITNAVFILLKVRSINNISRLLNNFKCIIRYLIVNNFKDIIFRNIIILNKYLDKNYNILPRKLTGLTKKYQKIVTRDIKIARFISLLPYIKRNIYSKYKR